MRELFMNRDNDKGKTLLQRTLVLALFNFVLICVLICRLYYLQVYQGEKYKTLSDENRISTRMLVPPRGIIYDRNGEILATNEQNFQASIIAEQAQNVTETLEKLKRILPLHEAQEDKILRDIARNRKFVPIKIKDNLSWEEVSAVLLNTPYLPGISIDQGLSRAYPYGLYTAQFLGYVAAVSDKDEKDDPLLSVPGFKIGKAGLEKSFDKQLRGTGGSLKLEVNAYGRVMKEIEVNKGIEGQNLRLSIDIRLQKFAQEAFGNQSGAAVLLDVHSGEILAFVSTPSFDPNLFTNGISHRDWNELLYNERHPLTDKAVSGQYSPGSTFKVVVALAALEAGVINERTSFSCQGMMPLGDHKFHCWRHQGHGPQTVVEALKNSCDIFFYEVALRLGIDRIASMARQLGLGAPTGIALENERGGLIPDKAWKKARYGVATG
jgi:penicillin-binding protein 2